MMENTIAQIQNVFISLYVFWITDFVTPWSFDALRDFGAPRLFAIKDTHGVITYPHLKADGKYRCTVSKCVEHFLENDVLFKIIQLEYCTVCRESFFVVGFI